MINIIKSLKYQVLRDNFTYYALIAVIGCIAITIYSGIDAQSEFRGCDMTVYIGQGSLIMFVPYLLSSTRIMGWDCGDKTINYEILSGHSRAEAYWGRVIVAITCSVVFYIIYAVIPVLFCTLVNGWGNAMDMGGAILRIVLLILPTIRMNCEFIFFTILAGNGYIGLLIGYLFTEFGAIIGVLSEELSKINITWQLAICNAVELGEFNSTMGFADGEDITYYIADLETSVIISTVVVSLTVSAVLLIMGYFIFKKRDLR